MAFNSAQKSRVLLGDFSLSGYLTSVQVPQTTDMLETTTLADTAKRFIPGQTTSTVAMSGYSDELTLPDSVAWTTPQPLTYAPVGLAAASQVLMVNTEKASLSCQSAVNGVAMFDLAGQTDAQTSFGVSLADLAAVVGNTNGTGVDGGAATSNGCFAHLHVTAYSGFTNVVFTIQDSANNSTFATIGTFTTVTGVTTERLTIAGAVRQYTRVVATVTGSGSVTFSAALARI